MTTDVDVNDNAGYWDIRFTDDGDIATEQNFETPILMGIFMERRAAPDEVPDSFRRRGWQGNESTPGFEMGSKFWQYEQAKVNFQLLSDVGDVIRDGEQWLVDGDFAISVAAKGVLQRGVVRVDLLIERANSEVDKKSFDLWENTSNF